MMVKNVTFLVLYVSISKLLREWFLSTLKTKIIKIYVYIYVYIYIAFKSFNIKIVAL